MAAGRKRQKGAALVLLRYSRAARRRGYFRLRLHSTSRHLQSPAICRILTLMPGAPESVKPEAPARLEARVPRRVHELMKRAARLQGRSVTDFVVTAVEAEARRVLEDEAILRVSLEDQKRIAKALLQPPKPNAALRRAFARHRKLIDSE